jgi:long-chain-fatty-acid--CoA ligase ACSBG
MTENAAYSHYNHLGRRKIGSVGPALTDEGAGSKIAEGTGEICTWSRGVMMGYMYMPEKTADTFDDEGYLRTGDVGMVDSNGFTHITGRIKELIITGGGENCAPVLLEEAIKARLPAVSNAVMIGDKQKYLVCLLTVKLEPDGKGGFTNILAPEAAAVDPACKTFEEAQQSEKWTTYLSQGIEDANKVAISRAQQTRKYGVLRGDFSPVGALPELTPTMKLRREVVHVKHLNFIKGLYGADFQPF